MSQSLLVRHRRRTGPDPAATPMPVLGELTWAANCTTPGRRPPDEGLALITVPVVAVGPTTKTRLPWLALEGAITRPRRDDGVGADGERGDVRQGSPAFPEPSSCQQQRHVLPRK